MKSPEAVAAFAAGNTLRREGRIDEAIAAFRRAIALDPANGNGHYNLGIALRQRGDLRGATLAFRDAARIRPQDLDAIQNVVETLALAIDADAPALFAPPPVERDTSGEPLSIVVCSIDPRRLETLQGNYRDVMGERPHEFVVIRDARSLCEGYQRGLEASRHDLVVFSHDDVALASAQPFDALARALQDHDVVGVVGSRLLNGPAVTWAGHPNLHGGVGYPPLAGHGWGATLYSLERGVLGGMQALDGLLFAARRQAALRVGFDARTFDGFHFYDVDFTYRAHLAGLRVAVTTELVAFHASRGQFDDAWKRYAERFRAKFPALDAPAGMNFYFNREFTTRARLLRFYAELRGLAAA